MSRVFLREFETADATRLFEIESLPEVVRYQDFEARTPESAERYVAGAISSHADDPRTYFDFAVCDKASGQMIGRVGGSIDLRKAWIWYVIDPACQGLGFGTEAVSQFVRRLPDVDSINIECDPRNVPSWKLAETLGFELVSEKASGTMIKGEDCGSKVYTLVPPWPWED